MVCGQLAQRQVPLLSPSSCPSISLSPGLGQSPPRAGGLPHGLPEASTRSHRQKSPGSVSPSPQPPSYCSFPEMTSSGERVPALLLKHPQMPIRCPQRGPGLPVPGATIPRLQELTSFGVPALAYCGESKILAQLGHPLRLLLSLQPQAELGASAAESHGLWPGLSHSHNPLQSLHSSCSTRQQAQPQPMPLTMM